MTRRAMRILKYGDVVERFGQLRAGWYSAKRDERAGYKLADTQREVVNKVLELAVDACRAFSRVRAEAAMDAAGFEAIDSLQISRDASEKVRFERRRPGVGRSAAKVRRERGAA